MKLQKKVMSVFLYVLQGIAGCTHFPQPEERISLANTLAESAGMQKTALPTPFFSLLSYYRFAPAENAVLDIYIEGDGFAWFSRTQPSLDPTPLNPVALKMAVNSQERNVAYIARPCQYNKVDNGNFCVVSEWTNRRFSEEAVVSVNEAVNVLKQQSGASSVRLTGFSGGGAIAVLVAARRYDVVQIITVAGNLDTAVWTDMHHTSPLQGSLNPVDVVPQLEKIPQIHFVGGNDSNITPAIAHSFKSAFRDGSVVQIVEVPEFTHTCCWAEQWPGLLKKVPSLALLPTPH